MDPAKLQIRREERRDAILDAARAVFLEDGYGAASMSDIAARVGGSKGTLYNYFPSKEDLFEAVVRRSCARIGAAVFDTTAAEPDLRPRLTRMAANFLSVLVTPETIAVQRLVVGEGDRFPELGRAFYASGPKVLMGRLAEVFKEWMARGELREADPHQAAIQFKGLVISGVYQERLWCVTEHPSPEVIEAQAAAAVDTFLRAYRP